MADAMKLLPCPMCGGEAALLDYEARYGGLHYASRCPQCTSCGCSMGYLPTAKKAVEAWNCRASMPAPEKAPSFDDARRKLIHCIEQWDGETEYDAEDIAALADDVLDVFASPQAREEAPAEGAGELIADLEALLAAEPVFVVNHPIQRAITALRDRTSEPAREAVACVIAFRDGKREPDLLSWNKLSIGEHRLYTHPAPATADKLKVAKEALLHARSDLLAFACARGSEYEGTSESVTSEIDQALATLNEQPQ